MTVGTKKVLPSHTEIAVPHSEETTVFQILLLRGKNTVEERKCPRTVSYLAEKAKIQPPPLPHSLIAEKYNSCKL